MIKLKRFIYEKLALAFFLAFMGLLLGAGAKLLSQTLFWLKNGYWEPYSILNLLRDLGIGVPRTPNFLGVQRIIDSAVSWPALVGLAAVAGLCVAIGAFFTVLGEQYDWEIQKRTDATLEENRAREAQEQRWAEAERSRMDFDFSEPIEELRSHKDPYA